MWSKESRSWHRRRLARVPSGGGMAVLRCLFPVAERGEGPAGERDFRREEKEGRKKGGGRRGWGPVRQLEASGDAHLLECFATAAVRSPGSLLREGSGRLRLDRWDELGASEPSDPDPRGRIEGWMGGCGWVGGSVGERGLGRRGFRWERSGVATQLGIGGSWSP